LFLATTIKAHDYRFVAGPRQNFRPGFFHVMGGPGPIGWKRLAEPGTTWRSDSWSVVMSARSGAPAPANTTPAMWPYLRPQNRILHRPAKRARAALSIRAPRKGLRDRAINRRAARLRSAPFRGGGAH